MQGPHSACSGDQLETDRFQSVENLHCSEFGIVSFTWSMMISATLKTKTVKTISKSTLKLKGSVTFLLNELRVMTSTLGLTGDPQHKLAADFPE